MLRMADIVVITKGDIVSQAEREVFAARVHAVNPTAIIMNINGLTGQGAYELSTLLFDQEKHIDSLKGSKLRFSMPAALCSYCLGETRIGESYQMGNLRKIKLEEKPKWQVKNIYCSIRQLRYLNVILTWNRFLQVV
jgi:G3E family GTPase